MTNKNDNRIKAILDDIYQIDPTLVEFEADLLRLITTLEANRPSIATNQEFVSELRASLLSYKPARVVTKTHEVNPFSWWFIRLIPVGISMVLLIVLVPDLFISPSQNPDSQNSELFEDTLPGSTDTEMRMDSLMLESDTEGTSDDTSMLSIENSATSLEVNPPQAGNTLTITSVTMPDSGWIAVYRDEGGELGELLGSLFLPTSQQKEIFLMLDNELSYPGLLTVVVYTGNNTNQFDAVRETVQIDPLNDSPMMVTVPVISQLELDLME